MSPAPIVFVLRGIINSAESVTFEKDILARIATIHAPVIIRCEEAEYINSHAAGVLVHVHQILAQSNMGLYLVSPPPSILYILERAGISSILSIHESEEDARAAIGSEA